MQPDMQLRIGSITKQFTAVSILMLAEQGKLSVKDDVRKYLPDFPDKGSTITIEHLLQHTSGIPNYTALQAFRSLPDEGVTLAQVFDVFARERWTSRQASDIATVIQATFCLASSSKNCPA